MEAAILKNTLWVSFLASMIYWNKRKIVPGIGLTFSAMSVNNDFSVGREISPVVRTARVSSEVALVLVSLII